MTRSLLAPALVIAALTAALASGAAYAGDTRGVAQCVGASETSTHIGVQVCMPPID
jgi:hypothetical protein